MDSLRQAIIDAVKQLPERERLVLSLYYEQELNLKEIGAVLKVTESRVCQLHGQALLRLKSRLGEWQQYEPPRGRAQHYSAWRSLASRSCSARSSRVPECTRWSRPRPS